MKLRIGRRIQSLFVRPMLQLKRARNEARLSLSGLYNQLEHHFKQVQEENFQKTLVALVWFFGNVSEIQDDGVVERLIKVFEECDYGRYDYVLESLRELQLHVKSAGRCLEGLNRTKFGESVTQDNVFLGGVWGVWTFSVRDWLQHEEGPDQLKCQNGLTPHENIRLQAKGFVESHAKPMMWALGRLMNN